MPERSGFPSAVLGAGAERSALPSLSRGVPGILTLIHCADAMLHSNAVARARTDHFTSSHLLIWFLQLSFHPFVPMPECPSCLHFLHDTRIRTTGRAP